MYFDGTFNSIIRMWRIKNNHNTVTKVFIDKSTMGIYNLSNTVKIDIKKHERTNWFKLFCNRRKTDNIDEHNGENFSL